MTWLVDTNVLSELRKGDRAHPGTRAWFADARDEDLYTSVLAATALVHDMTLVTRNVRDVAVTGVRLLDPTADPAGPTG